MTPFKVIVQSRDKNIKKWKCSLFNSDNFSKHDYGRRTDSFRDRYMPKVGGVGSEWSRKMQSSFDNISISQSIN